MLYRSTDRLCRRGAPVKNLSHNASFESFDKDAPAKPGTKHQAGTRRAPHGRRARPRMTRRPALPAMSMNQVGGSGAATVAEKVSDQTFGPPRTEIESKAAN